MRNRYRVVGPRRIAGVKNGGTVELDSDRISVSALIEAGHIKPAVSTAKAPARNRPDEDEEVSE